MPEEFRRLFEGPDEIEQFPDPFGRVGEGATEISDPTFDPMGQKLFQDFRDAWAEGRALPELFGPTDTLEIKAGIGEGRRNRRPDVAKIETLMDTLGEHDASPTDGPTGFLNTRLEEDLQRFQARNGLTVDGIVDPGGETLREIQGELSRTLGPGALTPPSARRDATGNRFDASGGDPLAGVPEGPGDGANLIPTQSTGGLPGRGRDGRPAAGGSLTREEFLRISRESERRRKRALKDEFLEASRGSERRLNHELDEIERKARQLLNGAKRLNDAVAVGRFIPGPLSAPDVRVSKAIKAWERYLDGTGGAVDYDPRWILRHKALRTAANRIEGHYQDWMIGKRKPKDPSRAVAGRLLSLKSGRSITVSDDFDGRYKFDLSRNRFSDHRLLLGNGSIRANGTFTFSRKGNIIEVTGVIENRIRDPFDFTEGQVARFFPRISVRHDDMIRLEQHGRAKTFIIRSTWRRRIKGRLRIVPIPGTKSSQLVWIDRAEWTDE
ncbi:MAG TPA: peptidoglycan-binding domain-containing protein [Alphaproteobacteria bacterium]|nr:peptidoglycan-binding domain-containing protein [Alphaproteobacteria bacterium]